MDISLIKDSVGNWHLPGVMSGSVREQRLCRRLARVFLNDNLIANTPNFLVDAVVRHRTATWSDLPSLMAHCTEIFFYNFDGRVYFLFK